MLTPKGAHVVSAERMVCVGGVVQAAISFRQVKEFAREEQESSRCVVVHKLQRGQPGQSRVEVTRRLAHVTMIKPPPVYS